MRKDIIRQALFTFISAIAVTSAYAEPLNCDPDEDGNIVSNASWGVCDLIDFNDLPDEAYGWSIQNGQSSYDDPFVFLARYDTSWEVYGTLFDGTYDSQSLQLEKPPQIAPADEEFWEEYVPDDSVREVYTTFAHEIYSLLPPSAGVQVREVLAKQGLESALTEYDYEAFFETTGEICVGGRFLDIYVIQQGQAYHGNSLYACNAPVPQLPLVMAINQQLVKFGITTPEFLEHLPHTFETNAGTNEDGDGPT